MKKSCPQILIILFLILSSSSMKAQKYIWPDVKPPIAEIKSHIRDIHGDKVEDNYYWMIDFFKKGPDSTKVVSYLEAENDYLDKMMAGTKQMQENLFTEMKNRIKEKDESVPVYKNGYYYYSRSEEGKQYYKYCRKKGNLKGKEEVLLDVDKMAEGHSYFALSGIQVSPDNSMIAYGVDTVSRRQYTIHIKNLITGKVLKDHIPSTNGNLVWANDNKTIFYTANNPETLLSEKIKRHILNTDEKNDVIVYEEKDNTNYIGVDRSKNDQYIFIVSAGTMSSEYQFIDASKPQSAFVPFKKRMKDVLYDVIPLENKFLIRTNWNAKNFRLMECPFDKTESE
ncbi:MAG: oligopeptidase B, partial [Ginsengibacter sp.]